MLNIRKTMHNQLDQKIRKIQSSAEMIHKKEQRKIKEIESRKLTQYANSQINMTQIKEKLKLIKDKKQIKYENVLHKINQLNGSFLQKQKDFVKNLQEKNRKIQEIKKLNTRIEDFISKRHVSLGRVSDNSIILNEFRKSRNNIIVKNHLHHSSRSNEKNRSAEHSNENNR